MHAPEVIALAALLHDVGKLYQRAYWKRAPAELADSTHTAYTAWFVKRHDALFQRAGVEPNWLARTAKRHHQWQDRPAYQPETPEEWAIILADNYASRERRAAAARGVPASTPLHPIFDEVALAGRARDKMLGYHLEPLGVQRSYPTTNANVRSEAYDGKLVQQLDARLTALAGLELDASTLLLNLAGFLQEVAWCVPSDTQGEPGVSLYDHLCLTSNVPDVNESLRSRVIHR